MIEPVSHLSVEGRHGPNNAALFSHIPSIGTQALLSYVLPWVCNSTHASSLKKVIHLFFVDHGSHIHAHTYVHMHIRMHKCTQNFTLMWGSLMLASHNAHSHPTISVISVKWITFASIGPSTTKIYHKYSGVCVCATKKEEYLMLRICVISQKCHRTHQLLCYNLYSHYILINDGDWLVISVAYPPIPSICVSSDNR